MQYLSVPGNVYATTSAGQLVKRYQSPDLGYQVAAIQSEHAEHAIVPSVELLIEGLEWSGATECKTDLYQARCVSLPLAVQVTAPAAPEIA